MVTRLSRYTILLAAALIGGVSGGSLPGTTHANGIPQLVALTYLPELSNYGSALAMGALEFSFADGYLRLDAQGLTPSNGNVYQGWLIKSDQNDAIPVGKFIVGSDGTAAWQTTLPAITDYGYDLFLLTVEPDPDPATEPSDNRSIGGYFTDGFFVVQRPGGVPAYTRDGSFRLDAEGSLVTVNGYRLEPPVIIAPDASDIIIEPDGVITALIGEPKERQEIASIQLARFINPAGLLGLGENLFEATAASGEVFIDKPGEVGLGVLRSRMLEGSNVQLVDEMGVAHGPARLPDECLPLPLRGRNEPPGHGPGQRIRTER